MIETFKILTNIYDSRVTNFLTKSNFSSTSGHKFKLFVQHVNIDIRKCFFSFRIVDIWYRLPSSVVNAPNVMCFERRLDKCLADLKVKFDHEAPLRANISSEHVTSALVTGTTAATFFSFEKMSQLTVKECILNSAPKSCELE